jgi:hypothetical protein
MTRTCRRALRALRGFLVGFTGMPSARLEAPGPRCGRGAAHAARHALAEQAARRPRCC